jgi:N-acyl-D-amino-acid deacylase
VAPCRPDAGEILMNDLVNVEAIPLEVMRRAIAWRWESFPQWMDALVATPLGINVAPLVPLISGSTAAAARRASTCRPGS